MERRQQEVKRQQEAAKQEAAKQEAAKQEAAKREAEAKQEAAKQEAAKQEAAKQEAARREAAKQEADRKEAARKEAEERQRAQLPLTGRLISEGDPRPNSILPAYKEFTKTWTVANTSSRAWPEGVRVVVEGESGLEAHVPALPPNAQHEIHLTFSADIVKPTH